MRRMNDWFAVTETYGVDEGTAFLCKRACVIPSRTSWFVAVAVAAHVGDQNRHTGFGERWSNLAPRETSREETVPQDHGRAAGFAANPIVKFDAREVGRDALEVRDLCSCH